MPERASEELSEAMAAVAAAAGVAADEAVRSLYSMVHVHSESHQHGMSAQKSDWSIQT